MMTFVLPHIDVLVDNAAKKRHLFIHGWIFKVQPDYNGRGRQRESYLYHALGNLML
jgi:excinuclease UvrABC nuclease subunit